MDSCRLYRLSSSREGQHFEGHRATSNKWPMRSQQARITTCNGIAAMVTDRLPDMHRPAPSPGGQHVAPGKAGPVISDPDPKHCPNGQDRLAKPTSCWGRLGHMRKRPCKHIRASKQGEVTDERPAFRP